MLHTFYFPRSPNYFFNNMQLLTAFTFIIAAVVINLTFYHLLKLLMIEGAFYRFVSISLQIVHWIAVQLIFIFYCEYLCGPITEIALREGTLLLCQAYSISYLYSVLICIQLLLPFTTKLFLPEKTFIICG